MAFSTPQKVQRRALGAADRRRWASMVRQDDVQGVVDQLISPGLYGTAILGPRGSGKSVLAANVERRLAEQLHVIRLFAIPGLEAEPFGVFAVLLAKLTPEQAATPESTVQSLVELVSNEAHETATVLILEGLPGIDSWSTGVIMRLLLGGHAKLLLMARSAAELPEDLVWLIKDGLLSQHRIGPLTRVEIQALLEGALDGPVASSAVSTLHRASGGNALVLHALVNEYIGGGGLREHDGTWMMLGQLKLSADDFLGDLVGDWMAQEPAAVRVALEKAALLQEFSLPTAILALGAEEATQLEELGFLSVGAGPENTLSFAEPYLAPTIRAMLSVEEKAGYFKEVSQKISLRPAGLTSRQLTIFADWRRGAQLPLDPETALAAAQAAVHFLDPELAFFCCAQVPPDHRLNVPAAQVRSQAHFILGDYAQAADVLESIGLDALESLSPEAYAFWVMDLVKVLVWLPDGHTRVQKLLVQARNRIQATAGADAGMAREWLQLAEYEDAVHRGNHAQVVRQLEEGSHNTSNHEYRLNCASLLTMAMAVTGRELEAVQLSVDIERDVEKYQIRLKMEAWHMRGRILALAWSGQWRRCEEALAHFLDRSAGMARLFGSTMELSLGIACLLAQRIPQALKILRKSAAQLELRNSYHYMELVYSALSYAYAELKEVEHSRKYLALAMEETAVTDWAGAALAEYFQLRAVALTSDPTAMTRLVARAREDLLRGNFTTAATSAFAAASSTGNSEHYALLEAAAQRCQGPLAVIRERLATAHRTGNAELAMEAAEEARRFELRTVELQGVQQALLHASVAGETRLVRAAQERINSLLPKQPQLSGNPAAVLTPRERQVAHLATQGMSNREIAANIDVSVRTVEGHLYQVFAKMHISSRASLEGRPRP